MSFTNDNSLATSALIASGSRFEGVARPDEIADGSVREIVRNEGRASTDYPARSRRTTSRVVAASWFSPVAWDRARGISTAAMVGPGGFADGSTAEHRDLYAWPLAEPTQVRTLSAAADEYQLPRCRSARSPSTDRQKRKGQQHAD